MDGKAIVQSVIQEIVQPGVQRLMESRYFSELREGKLSIRRLQGWAIQHYLHNKAILKSFALGMVKNAHDQDMFNYYTYQFNEEQTHPDLAKKFGLALGLKEEDFADATQIFECQIHSARTIYNTLIGGGLPRIGADQRKHGLPLLRGVQYLSAQELRPKRRRAHVLHGAHGRRQGAHRSIRRANRPGRQNTARRASGARERAVHGADQVGQV
jgi:TENA/THI-4/PQQC family